MALNLSSERRKELKRYLELAEPYEENDSAFEVFDGEMTDERRSRVQATIAKRLLEQDDLEKAGGTTDGEG